MGRRVVLATVVRAPDGVLPDTVLPRGPLEGQTVIEALQTDARDSLYALRYPFESRDVPLDYEVLVGDAAHEMVRRSRGTRMIVVGTHGRRGLKRILFGSVAEEILRRADVPVLTVRTEGSDSHPTAVQDAVAALGHRAE